MKLIFSEHAWEDYLYWQRTDRKILQRINALIKEIQRAPFEGIGKPEPLKHGLSGYWSRRINGNVVSFIRLRQILSFLPSFVITTDLLTPHA